MIFDWKPPVGGFRVYEGFEAAGIVRKKQSAIGVKKAIFSSSNLGNPRVWGTPPPSEKP